VPIYRAVLKAEARLSLGAPRDFTIINVAGAAIAFLWRLWPLLPLAVVLQLGAAWATRLDPHWLAKGWRVWRYKAYYKS